MKIMDGKPHLFEMIGALHPPCGFPGSLNRRQKQGNQHADNRNDDQQFDKCEGNIALPRIFTGYSISVHDNFFFVRGSICRGFSPHKQQKQCTLIGRNANVIFRQNTV